MITTIRTLEAPCHVWVPGPHGPVRQVGNPGDELVFNGRHCAIERTGAAGARRASQPREAEPGRGVSAPEGGAGFGGTGAEPPEGTPSFAARLFGNREGSDE